MKEIWYVRNTAGKVFGPIDLEALQSWVRDGRIEPLSGISNDLKSWILAPLKPELEMDWIVENNPGQFYGPTHRSVVDDLVKTGTLSPAARFYHDDHGSGEDRLHALEAAVAARDAALVQKETSLAEAQKLSAKKDLQLAASQKAVRERDDRLSDAKAQLAQKDMQLSDFAKAVSLRDGQLQQRDQELARRDEEASRLRAEIERLTMEVESLKAQLAKREEVHAREWESEVLVPEVVTNEMPPPVARQAFSKNPFSSGAPSSLADLERRAQQELARMGASGAKKFFKNIRK